MADLIDRAALKMDTWERLSDAMCALVDAPTIDAKPVVRGHWMWDTVDEVWFCSVCDCCALNNYRGLTTDSNYCPTCGAKMDGERKET